MADDGTTPPDTATTRSAPRWMRAIVVGGTLLAVLLLGASLGMLVQPPGWGSAEPDADSVDVGFAQDMSVHHRQAVLMAGLARERSTNIEIRSLAFDIEHTQLEQIGRMQGWLSLWNAAPVSTAPMAWMPSQGSMPGHGSMSGHEGSLSGYGAMPGMTQGSGPGTDGTAAPMMMPGMASPAELDQLRATRGPEFDVLFLKLMLRHHQGGIPMARYAAEHADTAQVRNLAEKILVAQNAESEYLTKLITQRGAVPFPAPI